MLAPSHCFGQTINNPQLHVPLDPNKTVEAIKSNYTMRKKKEKNETSKKPAGTTPRGIFIAVFQSSL